MTVDFTSFKATFLYHFLCFKVRFHFTESAVESASGSAAPTSPRERERARRSQNFARARAHPALPKIGSAQYSD